MATSLTLEGPPVQVDVETLDRRWSKVVAKKRRHTATVSCTCNAAGTDFTISIKTKVSSDLYVTQQLQLSGKHKADGKLWVKVPEHRAYLAISGATPEAIERFITGVHSLGKKQEPTEKENESGRANGATATATAAAHGTPCKHRGAAASSGSPPEPRSAGKTKTPIKKRLNVGTPSKPLLLAGLCGAVQQYQHQHRQQQQQQPANTSQTPQSCRKQPRLKVTSPGVHAPRPQRSPTAGAATSERGGTACALTCEQEAALAAALHGESLFLTGGAGTGKSVTLLRIIEQLVQKHGQHTVFITATTGLAACAIGGMTVHQFAGIAVAAGGGDAADGDVDVEETVRCALQKPHVVRRIRQARVLVVDEISMMGPSLLEALHGIAQGARASAAPMGGLQVVFAGDFFQLPPVTKIPLPGAGGGGGGVYGRGLDGYVQFNHPPAAPLSSSQDDPWPATAPSQLPPAPPPPAPGPGPGPAATQAAASHGTKPTAPRFCFQSPVWNRIIDARCFTLTQVFRQRDPAFVELLNAVRWGEVTDAVRDALRVCVGRKFDCTDGILPTSIFTHRRDVDTLNTRELAALPGAAVEYKACDTGDAAFLRMLTHHCPARPLLRLKVGAQVVLVKNVDPRDGLVNGARGVVTRLTRDTKRPVVRFTDGVERTVMNEVFSVSVAGRVVAQRTQLPLDLAWGLSVHKSQGMGVDRAVLHLKKAFEYGQAYVALSRVRSKDGLSIDVAPSAAHIRAHPDVKAFYRLIDSKKESRKG